MAPQFRVSSQEVEGLCWLLYCFIFFCFVLFLCVNIFFLSGRQCSFLPFFFFYSCADIFPLVPLSDITIFVYYFAFMCDGIFIFIYATFFFIFSLYENVSLVLNLIYVL